jgi:hypothetical protein
VPAGSAGLGKLLPAALERSSAEAARLVRRMPEQERRCLQEYLRGLTRLQRKRGVALPFELLPRTLAIF